MKKENKSTQNKLENTPNTNWLNVLAFGSEVDKPKAKNNFLQTHEPIFEVLP